jgi:lysophospholipase L1-like esterase
VDLRTPSLLFLLALALPLTARAEDAAKLSLKKGDRIVFLGDSITQGGVSKKGYVTLVKQSPDKGHADLGIEVIGAGISGNKVPDLQARLERDVLKKKPTIVVIYIGINDVWHGEKDPSRGTSPEKYEAGLKDVIGRIQKAGSRVLVCTPSVIGEKADGTNKNDKRLDEYSELSRKVAKELKVPACDLRKAFIDRLKKDNKAGKASGVLTGDGVHLNDAGNKLVADAILEALGN